jgi:hypothetical protein
VDHAQGRGGRGGTLSGTWTSFDEGVEALPLASIAFKDSELTRTTKHGATYNVESKLIGAKYSGTKMKDGTGYEGQFAQYGMKNPLALRKTDRLSAAARPQMPRPPFSYSTP